MRSILVSAVAVVLLAPTVCRADDKAEWKKLLGDWKLLSAKRGGKDVEEVKIGSLKIEKDKFTITAEINGEKRSMPTAVKIDFSKSPKQIDFIGKDGEPTSHGIFKLEGKKLTFCFDRAKRDRPKKFESKEGTRVSMLIFERAKKE